MIVIAPRKEIKKKTCTACGKELSLTRGFYLSKSPLYALDERINVCKDCFISNSLDSSTGKIDEKKFKNMLRKTDFPFYKDNLYSAKQQFIKEHGHVPEDEVEYYGDEIIKLYMKNVNSLRQLTNKTYSDSEQDGFVQKRSTIFKNQKPKVDNEEETEKVATTPKKSSSTTSKPEQVWTKKDEQNMKYVLSTIGYDPYEDIGLSEMDRKYCFNILSGYCGTDGITEDGHKLQGVIEMTMLYCQCKKITEAMNIELSKSNMDDSKISKLTASKSSLLSSIATIAKDNNISSNYNKNSKQGRNSLGSLMKEMEENGFKEIKVNLFDIKTCEAFRQIDNISNQNISNQLTLDNSEYSDMVKEQREMIKNFEIDLEKLKEENRQLKNKILLLERGVADGNS